MIDLLNVYKSITLSKTLDNELILQFIHVYYKILKIIIRKLIFKKVNF